MALSNEQIVEIQTTAAFNQKKRARELEEQKALKQEVAKAVKESKSTSTKKEK